MNTTEKFISLIRSNPCLYDRSDKYYKCSNKKDIVWERISKELNLSRYATRKKWKNLKDGYTKYKKELKGFVGKPKKYLNWVWGPYLEFLDCSLKSQPSTSYLCNPSSPADHSKKCSSVSPTPTEEGQSNESPSPLSQIPVVQSSETPSLDIKYPFTTYGDRNSVCEDNVDKILNYLISTNNRDAVDLLFASYAESFKKLKTRTQAEVKLKLAHIFTEAELKDQGEDPISASSASLHTSYYNDTVSDMSICLKVENEN